MKLLWSLPICLSLTFCGCARFHSANTVFEALEHNTVQGMDKETDFSFTFPETVAGPYTTTRILNAEVLNGTYKGHNASFLLGKSRYSKKWQIIAVYVEQEEKWVPLAVKSSNE